ncbi:MAG: rod shape-determining protein [Novosphingobium sp.]|nr:rod shape-determining protein [Novosphingobium sp.]
MFDFSPFRVVDLAIDLGTANTVVYVKGEGVVLAEPSVVALETINGITRVRAIGDDAKLMLGKTPDNVRTIRPLRAGVVADIEVAEQMLRHFVEKTTGSRRRGRGGPEMVICVPSGSTTVERRAIRDAASRAGARRVWLIDEPMAAGIGADLPVNEPTGSMVVDIGGGTTEVGVISIQGLSMAMSVRIGGDQMDDAIAAAVRRRHNMLIGEATAEKIKKEAGAAQLAAGAEKTMVTIKGRDVARGVPREIEVAQSLLVEALTEPVDQIVLAVRRALENTPPEIAADIIEAGIVMTGGGSLLPGIDAVLSEQTGLPVRIADDPMNCTAVGAGRTLEELAYRGVLHPA